MCVVPDIVAVPWTSLPCRDAELEWGPEGGGVKVRVDAQVGDIGGLWEVTKTARHPVALTAGCEGIADQVEACQNQNENTLLSRTTEI